MYLEYFGFDKKPFSLTPDTDFFYTSHSCQEALNVLLFALESGEGFVKIVGEVGAGKSTLCRTLLNKLVEPYYTAYVPNPYINPQALRVALAQELGLNFPRNIGQHRLIGLIQERLIELANEDKKVVLVLDEAQAMPDDTLESLRLITNFETEKRKLLQVVMFGQPELDQRLQEHKHRQLLQRVTFSYQLSSLTQEELPSYLNHRTSVAGHSGMPLFGNSASKSLYKVTKGVPRLVNVLANKALLAAYGEGAKEVAKRHIQRAASDTEAIRVKPSLSLPSRIMAATASVGVAAAVAWVVVRMSYV